MVVEMPSSPYRWWIYSDPRRRTEQMEWLVDNLGPLRQHGPWTKGSAHWKFLCRGDAMWFKMALGV